MIYDDNPYKRFKVKGYVIEKVPFTLSIDVDNEEEAKLIVEKMIKNNEISSIRGNPVIDYSIEEILDKLTDQYYY